MGKHALIPANNPEHNVPALLKSAGRSLRALAKACFIAEVAGQAPATSDAKKRDLARFFTF